MDDGRFDDLPHQGRRLPIEDDNAAGDWAMAYRLMRDAGVAPAWIEADKQARRWLEQIERLLAQAHRVGPLGRPRLRRDLESAIAALDTAVLQLNADAPTDRQHRMRPHRSELLARLEAAFHR